MILPTTHSPPASCSAPTHAAAVDYLEGRGVPVTRVSAQTFTGDFKTAVAAQRAHLLSNPVRHSIIGIWRSATRLTPHMGSIHGQPLAQRQIERLLTGVRG